MRAKSAEFTVRSFSIFLLDRASERVSMIDIDRVPSLKLLLYAPFEGVLRIYVMDSRECDRVSGVSNDLPGDRVSSNRFDRDYTRLLILDIVLHSLEH